MKTETVESYPSTTMAVYYNPGTMEVYQLVFETNGKFLTRLDKMWRELSDDDDSLENLNYYHILPSDWKAANDLFDDNQFENRVMKITELKDLWASYVNKDGEFV
jgi:hypothetical protein